MLDLSNVGKKLEIAATKHMPLKEASEEDNDPTPRVAGPLIFRKTKGETVDEQSEIPSEKPEHTKLVIPTTNLRVRHPVRRTASSNAIFSQQNRLIDLVKSINNNKGK